MTRKTREAVQAALNHLENALTTKDGRVHFSDMVRVRNARALLAEALAEPERECDVHTADELKGIFKSELVLELPIANEHEKNLVTITAMGVIDALFATAKKGGNDGE